MIMVSTKHIAVLFKLSEGITVLYRCLAISVSVSVNSMCLDDTISNCNSSLIRNILVLI